MTQLTHLYLEMAVNHEERMLANDTRVTKELEAILTRAILQQTPDCTKHNGEM